MRKKCYPGVICIEIMSLFIILSICAIVVYLGYMRTSSGSSGSSGSSQPSQHQSQQGQQGQVMSYYDMLMNHGQGYGHDSGSRDVLLNPYVPPVNMSNSMQSQYGSMQSMQSQYGSHHPPVPPGRVPVNVSTNAGHAQSSYTQTGILTPLGGNNPILALMGRQLHSSRQKWQYYTISDSNNSVKLPVVHNGRSCTREHGCDELTSGETIYVEGYGKAFKVTMYENDAMQYIPYL